MIIKIGYYILQAGIDSSRLIVALEPEAAAVFLKHLPVDKTREGNADDMLQTFAPGSKYMVVDAGGIVYIHTNK